MLLSAAKISKSRLPRPAGPPTFWDPLSKPPISLDFDSHMHAGESVVYITVM